MCSSIVQKSKESLKTLMQKPEYCSFPSRVHCRKGKGSCFSRQSRTHLTPEQTDQPLALLKKHYMFSYLSFAMKAF